jgi:hypothetical protein
MQPLSWTVVGGQTDSQNQKRNLKFMNFLKILGRILKKPSPNNAVTLNLNNSANIGPLLLPHTSK